MVSALVQGLCMLIDDERQKYFLSWYVEISRLFLCIFNKNIVLFYQSETSV